jgi:integrase/recombinase XerD
LEVNAEESLKRYIIEMRDKVSSATLHNRIASIYHFYDMNDIVINKTKISKFKGEFKRVKHDRAYTREEIGRFLELSDLRLKVCILLMAGSGLRYGAISDLKLRNLQDNKLTVYENTNEEYFTFITPECCKYINEYLEYRKRCYETITSDSYLIRNHFNDYTVTRKAEGVSRHSIHSIFYHVLLKSGINANVQMMHGFRKFFTTQLIDSDVNPEIREMLLGHKIGLTPVYYRPTEQKMLDEYQKAVNNLTINEENRLKIKVQLLESEKTNYEKLDARMDQMQRDFYEYKVKTGFAGLTKEDLSGEYIQQKIQERRTGDKIRRERERRILEEIENESRKKY